jgi:hypothetical protein
MLCAHPSRCSSRYAARISEVIQVPGLAARGAAQPSTTALKSRSMEEVKPALRSRLARLREQ